MKNLLLIIGILFSGLAFSQPPPTSAMPKANQEKLIDELIIVSNYEEALINYSRVYLFATQYKDGKRRYENKEMDEVLKNFDFEQFKKNSIYNSFSFIPEEKLKNLILFYKENKGKIDTKNNVIMITASISHNLQFQLNSEMDKLLKTQTK